MGETRILRLRHGLNTIPLRRRRGQKAEQSQEVLQAVHPQSNSNPDKTPQVSMPAIAVLSMTGKTFQTRMQPTRRTPRGAWLRLLGTPSDMLWPGDLRN